MAGYPLAAASRRGLSRMVLGVRFHGVEHGIEILMVEMAAGDGIEVTRSAVTGTGCGCRCCV
jgi:hypothetical protein